MKSRAINPRRTFVAAVGPPSSRGAPRAPRPRLHALVTTTVTVLQVVGPVLGILPLCAYAAAPDELTTRVSLAPGGQEPDGPSGRPAISGDGRFVAFESLARNLVVGDTNGRRDIFVYDAQARDLTRASMSTEGAEANGDSFNPAISADGRFVAFESAARNLVAGDTNRRRDIFVHDRQTGETARVSVATSGAQAHGDSFHPAISGDGRLVAFESVARNLVTGDTSGRRDIFVHDRQTGETTRVSVATSGAQANGDSFRPSISGDGRLVAFESVARNLVTGDTSGRRDIFVHDRQTAATTRVSVGTGGTQAFGDSFHPAISADGRFVAFESLARDLVAEDTNRVSDVFLHDRLTGRTTRESLPAPDLQADGRSGEPAIDADGSTLAFSSNATNLVDADGDRRRDVFLLEHTQTAVLIARGADLFFNETFGGNGRTCGTCHPAENNFTIDPVFIATLPPDNPLFVAEFDPNLARLENPRLLREFGLVLENLDGFARPGVMRGVPHTLGLATSVRSLAGPRTGWSGDGAPLDGSLRSFAVGAVIQHFTKRLDRVEGIDFRRPTEDELDAIEAFMLSLGRQNDLVLPLPLKSFRAIKGQEIFMDNSRGRCNMCHVNAGANTSTGLGNASFNTGVENLPDHPARQTGEPMPIDGGFDTAPRVNGGFGDGTFNVPPLVEAADTPPFFHNNVIDTIEGAVAFYNSEAFNRSPAAAEFGAISLDAGEVEAVAAFLRVINALENIRSASQYQRIALRTRHRAQRRPLLALGGKELDDAIFVLAGAGLHPDAVGLLSGAIALNDRGFVQASIDRARAARNLIVEP